MIIVLAVESFHEVLNIVHGNGGDGSNVTVEGVDTVEQPSVDAAEPSVVALLTFVVALHHILFHFIKFGLINVLLKIIDLAGDDIQNFLLHFRLHGEGGYNVDVHGIHAIHRALCRD